MMEHVDTAIAVSPAGLEMWTRDADVIHQVFSRSRSDFQKPLQHMGMLRMYGEPLTASEGSLARHLQRIIMPAFNETTFQQAWHESLRLCGVMKESWIQGRNDKVILISNVNSQTACLTARVLLAALYDMKVNWARELNQNQVPPGHQMSLIEASTVAMDAMLPKFLIPDVVLANAPIASLNRLWVAYNEFFQYMREMKRDSLERLAKQEVPDERLMLLGVCQNLL